MSKLEELEKKFGLKQAVIDKSKVISTGSLRLDEALDNGGLVLGKVVEAFGDFSSGKSTATLHVMAEAQKAYPERQVALFDYEHSFDAEYAANIGVNVDDMLIYQPFSMEQGYNMITSLVESGIVSVVVIDSHTAAMPAKILEGEIGDATISIAARRNSEFLGKLKGLLKKHDVLLFATSQLRANIGGYGAAVLTTGGNAWKFYADVRLSFQKENDKEHELSKTTITVVKNKCGKPFKSAKINILWGQGYDKTGEVIDIAVEKNIIAKGGSWFTYGDIKVQGRESLIKLAEDNPELLLEFQNKIKC